MKSSQSCSVRREIYRLLLLFFLVAMTNAYTVSQGDAEDYCSSLGGGWRVAYTDDTYGSLYCLFGDQLAGNNCNDCSTYRIVVWEHGGGETFFDGASYPFTTAAGFVYSSHTDPCAFGPTTLGAPCDNFLDPATTYQTSSAIQGQADAVAYCDSLGSDWSIAHTEEIYGSLYCMFGEKLRL